MGLNEIFKGRKASDTDEQLAAADIEQPGWVAQSVHKAVAEQVDGTSAERALATSRTADKMRQVIDEILDPGEGAVHITDPVVRDDLETQRDELIKLAQQPELPPDGDHPAA